MKDEPEIPEINGCFEGVAVLILVGIIFGSPLVALGIIVWGLVELAK